MLNQQTYCRIYSQLDPVEKKRQNIASGTILAVLTLERLAFYALSSSFVLFLNEGPWDEEYSWNSLDALNAVFMLLGISYVSALIGGYISDAWLGRYKGILLGFMLYIIGFILLTLMSVGMFPRWVWKLDTYEDFHVGEEPPRAPCKLLVYTCVLIVGVGAGTFRSNIAPFGHEQLRFASETKVRSFFNWFYWCTNFGSLVGIGAVAYIEQDNPGICTNGFFCGYLIATGCLILAAILFIVAYPWYHKVEPEGSALFGIFRILWEAVTSQVRHWKYKRLYPQTNPAQIEPSCLDRAKIRYGGSFHEGAVDDVRGLSKMTLLFTALVPYWLVYFQMESTFPVQGLHMRIGSAQNGTAPLDQNNGFSVPVAWLTLFNQTFLFFMIPFLANFLYPKLDRAGFKLTCFYRIGLGMVFSTIAVVTAGALESTRLYLWNNYNSTHIDQVISNTTYHAVNISIFWQVPQYMLVGAAEGFASVAGLEYATSAAPPTFQGLIMGLFYSMEGNASFLGSTLLRLLSPFWFNNMTDYANINANHLDYYLYFLGTIQFLTLFIYVTALYIKRCSLQLIVMPVAEPDNVTLTSEEQNTESPHSR